LFFCSGFQCLGNMKLSDIDIEHLEEARKLIDKDISKHHTILAIARQVGLSESRLTRGFKLIHNVGLFEYLETARLEKGKYLVENTDKGLKEISRSIGYRYRSSFTMAFKKRFGKTPGNLRKNIK
jgi:AraC family transcriptional activator of pyochelin receptor